MAVLVTGATGLIGQELVKLLINEQHTVHYLTTSKQKIVNHDQYKGYYWNPKKNEIDGNAFKNVTAIFHLAGATVASKWTLDYKKEILQSRIESTQVLIEFLKNNTHSVNQVISASAIGIYPDNLKKIYTEETNEKANSLLSQVVQQWESAVDSFVYLGISTAKIRIGLVLSNKGGALLEMANPIKLGMGAAFGSGKQYQSWIHIEDLVSQFYFIYSNKLNGVFNGVAPYPVTQKNLVKAIAKELKRPLWLPNIPKFLMKILLGDMHVLLFESQNVSALKFLKLGYQYKFASLEKALQNLFQKKIN